MAPGPEDAAAASGGGAPDPVPGSGPGLARLALADAKGRQPVFQVCVSRMDAPVNIDEISFSLLDLALEHSGEYQGWSCPIDM